MCISNTFSITRDSRNRTISIEGKFINDIELSQLISFILHNRVNTISIINCVFNKTHFFTQIKYMPFNMVDLSKNNSWDDESVRLLSDFIRKNIIQNLNLSNNCFNDRNIQFLTKIGSLKVLDISNNFISDRGLQHILRLIKNSQLQQLNLNNNPIIYGRQKISEFFTSYIGGVEIYFDNSFFSNNVIFNRSTSGSSESLDRDSSEDTDLSRSSTNSSIDSSEDIDLSESSNEDTIASEDSKLFFENSEQPLEDINKELSQGIDQIIESIAQDQSPISMDKIQDLLRIIQDCIDKRSNCLMQSSKNEDKLSEICISESLKTFYFTLRSHIELKLISLLLLSVNVLQRKDTLSEQRIKQGVEIVIGGFDSMIAGIIGNAINVGVREFIERRVDKKMSKITDLIVSHLGNTQQAYKYAEKMAIEVTLKYKKLILERKIKPEEAKDYAAKTAKFIFQYLEECTSAISFHNIQGIVDKLDEDQIFNIIKKRSCCVLL